MNHWQQRTSRTRAAQIPKATLAYPPSAAYPTFKELEEQKPKVSSSASSPSLAMCNNKACKKAGSQDALAMLLALAGTDTSIGKRSDDEERSVAAAELQKNFAKSCIDQTGCLGKCGSGPNVVNTATGEVYRGVYTPSAATAALEDIGLDIPQAASMAYLKSLHAQRKLEDYLYSPRNNKGCLDESLALITEALNGAGTLRAGGAQLIHLLLQQRAKLHEHQGDGEAAQRDRNKAAQVVRLRYS